MVVDPFVVHVARLRRVSGTRWHEVRTGVLDPDGSLRPPTAADSAFPEGGEATCDVVLESFPGGVMVTGTVRAPWSGVCRRCAIGVGGELDVAVRERFVERRAAPAPFDDEAYPIVDDELDLRPMVRDAVALELPMAPLCQEGCRGLCPSCGADLNVETCDCVAPRDPRWANLDVLRSTPEEGPPAGRARRAT
ncbi:MAG TPA: DUF177 domain-containing protein [Acidimicrobiales bacterium]|nr:DUF177 domain-containing protein [Acidimicrobiales bacterium]